MASYKVSSGKRVLKSYIDYKVREAKKQVLQDQLDEHGYNFCVECGINSSNAIIDCSHDISVDECQKSGRSELAWNKSNIKPTCRECHKDKDNMNLKFKSYDKSRENGRNNV